MECLDGNYKLYIDSGHSRVMECIYKEGSCQITCPAAINLRQVNNYGDDKIWICSRSGIRTNKSSFFYRMMYSPLSLSEVYPGEDLDRLFKRSIS